ncbi:MAG: hypothetical protein GY765_08700 [bacterium]|nr:hypothetical protein [bacterium]
MNRTGKLNNWLDFHLNPVLVKDIRSWLRSKKFMMVFFFALTAIQVFTFHHTLTASRTGNHGETLFTILSCGLAFILTGVLPYLMQDRLAEELASRSTELSLISRLTPGQLVRGKIMGGMAVSMLFFSVAAPSFAVSYMLGGIGLDVVVYALCVLLFLSAATMVPAILVPALVGWKRRIRILSVLFLGTGIGGTLTMAYIIEMNRKGRLFKADFFTTSMLVGAVILLMMVFFYTSAIGRLSFEADNRDTKPRLVLTAIVVLNFLVFSLQGAIWPHAGKGTALTALAVSLYVFLFGVMFLIDTPKRLSDRLKNSWKRGGWRHLYYPGRGRLFLYIIAHMALFFCLSRVMGAGEQSVFFGGTSPDASMEALIMISTSVAFPGGGLLMQHLLMKRLKGLKGKKALLVILGAWLMLGILFSVSARSGILPDELHIFCPVTAVYFVIEKPNLFEQRGVGVLFAMLLILVPVLYFMLKYAVWDILEGLKLSAKNRRLRKQGKLRSTDD